MNLHSEAGQNVPDSVVTQSDEQSRRAVKKSRVGKDPVSHDALLEGQTFGQDDRNGWDESMEDRDTDDFDPNCVADDSGTVRRDGRSSQGTGSRQRWNGT